jgi:hypothetical protein
VASSVLKVGLETASPAALSVTFELDSAGCVGVNRTVTFCVAPWPDKVNRLPDVTLKGVDADTVPDTVPPRVFDSVNVCVAKLPTPTLPKLTLPVGFTPTARQMPGLTGARIGNRYLESRAFLNR